MVLPCEPPRDDRGLDQGWDSKQEQAGDKQWHRSELALTAVFDSRVNGDTGIGPHPVAAQQNGAISTMLTHEIHPP